MNITEIITQDPLTVTPSETVAQADELMIANKIGQLPIVERNELVGILTDRDIRSFLGTSLSESAETRERALNTQVREIMTAEPITLSPDDDLEEAVELVMF